jgi:hypothetical protein
MRQHRSALRRLPALVGTSKSGIALANIKIMVATLIITEIALHPIQHGWKMPSDEQERTFVHPAEHKMTTMHSAEQKGTTLHYDEQEVITLHSSEQKVCNIAFC